MKAKKISETTTNCGEFNRAYKHYLERKGEIHCSYCKYHQNENCTGKWYDGIIYDDMENVVVKEKEPIPDFLIGN